MVDIEQCPKCGSLQANWRQKGEPPREGSRCDPCRTFRQHVKSCKDEEFKTAMQQLYQHSFNE